MRFFSIYNTFAALYQVNSNYCSLRHVLFNTHTYSYSQEKIGQQFYIMFWMPALLIVIVLYMLYFLYFGSAFQTVRKTSQSIY